MDYGAMIQEHADSDTDVTVGCVEVSQEEGAAFGIMHVDDRDKVVDFLEKPADPPAMPDKPGRCLASMGIYVFSLQFLRQVLAEDAADETSSHDFGKDVIPRVVRHGIVRAHRFEKSCIKSDAEAESYWRDVGTVDAYWAANIDLAGVTPALDLYDATWPIYSYQEQLPSAKFVHDREGRRGMALDSLVSAGCIISGGTVRQSLLFNRVRVNSYAELGRAVILPGVDVGRSARLRNAIVDRGVHIPEGLVVGEDPDLDAARFHRTKKGVTLITEPMINALER
jgi:glucose-1-phosphate adenylyltransferase